MAFPENKALPLALPTSDSILKKKKKASGGCVELGRLFTAQGHLAKG